MVNLTLQLFYHKETNFENLRQSHPALSFCFSVLSAWNPLSQGIHTLMQILRSCVTFSGVLDSPLWNVLSTHTSQSLCVMSLASFFFTAFSTQSADIVVLLKCPALSSGCRGQQGLHVWGLKPAMFSEAQAEGAAGKGGKREFGGMKTCQ